MNSRHKWRWVSILTGFSVLALCASFIVRTRPFLGDRVATQVVNVARKRGIDIEIGTIHPHGLLGLTFENVALRIPRDSMAIECQFETLDVVPKLGSLLSGHVQVANLIATGGVITVVPWKSYRPQKVASKPTKTSHHVPRPPIDIELHEVALRGPLRGAKPLKITRLDFLLDERTPTKVSGYGQFPDGTRFGVRTDTTSGTERVSILPNNRTQIHDWVGADIPVNLSMSGIVVCLACESDQVVVKDVEFSAPSWSPARLTAPQANFTRRGSVLRLETLEMELDGAGAEFGARFVQTRIQLDASDGALSGRFKIAAREGGTLSVDWDYEHEFDLTLWAEEFAISSIWTALQLDIPIQPNLVDGTARVVLDPAGVIEVEGNLSFDAIHVDLPRVSGRPLTFRHTKVNGHALVDVPGRALSVSEASVSLGLSEPISLRGQLIEATRGWSFFAHVEAPKLNALTFRDGLPKELTAVAAGTIFDGTFGFALTVGGHSAFADSLYLEGELHGDVKVQRDGPNADMMSLNTNGPPPMLKNADLDNWRSYAQLPPIVPTVMLAAEDASFFRHPGFDWEGFKRAMIHNLGAGSLKRGGSTISQQVVKNLFLTRERSLARKLQEAYLTWRMETEIPKERILEIYINLVDWGGAVGIARAARLYFKTEPAQLRPEELAMLAAILPNPARFGGAIRKGKLPSSRMHKIGRILRNLSFMGSITYGESQRAFTRSLKGQIGRLNLTVCDDDGTVKDAEPCY